jgi:hypothetical protein
MTQTASLGSFESAVAALTTTVAVPAKSWPRSTPLAPATCDSEHLLKNDCEARRKDAERVVQNWHTAVVVLRKSIVPAKDAGDCKEGRYELSPWTNRSGGRRWAVSGIC